MFTLLAKALVLAVIGMGVVYLCLIVLMWTMQLLTWLYRSEAEAPAQAQAAAPAGEPPLERVLAAAAAHFLEAEQPSLYIPPVIRRSTRWAARGRAPAPLRRPR
ncbi:MAG: OadG family protein [Nitrospinota bacterium]